jgi:F-type H+-transporting ATPase subunit b
MLKYQLISMAEKVKESTVADNGLVKIAADLGLTLDAFFFYLICFSITFAILSYFLFKPLLQLIKNRQDQINYNINEQKNLETQILALQGEKATYKESIYHEKAKIIEEAKLEGKSQADTIISNAEAKAYQITSQAEKDSIQIRDTAKSQAEKEVIAFYSELINKNLSQLQLPSQYSQDVLNQLLKTPIK